MNFDDKALRKKLIRLAYTNPDIRTEILSVLTESDKIAASEELNEKSLVKYLNYQKSDGVSVSDLTYAFGGTSQKHTKFLKSLVTKGVLEKEGKKYRLVNAQNKTAGRTFGHSLSKVESEFLEAVAKEIAGLLMDEGFQLMRSAANTAEGWSEGEKFSAIFNFSGRGEIKSNVVFGKLSKKANINVLSLSAAQTASRIVYRHLDGVL